MSYFYLDANGQQQGPVNVNELRKYGVTKDTLVWTPGMNTWQAAGTVPQLAGMFTPIVTPPYQKYGNMYSTQPFNGNYPKASLGNRFLASLLDGLIMTGLAIPAIIAFVAGMVNLENRYSYDDAILLIILAILLYFIPLVYSFVKDGLGKGQSWGKKAVGLMVVHLPSNTPCTKGQSFLRCLIGLLVNMIPFIGWLIEPIMVLATQDGRRLADQAANTQVIDANRFNY
jgi:uncharacterized RDD family membrane protein YckC